MDNSGIRGCSMQVCKVQKYFFSENLQSVISNSYVPEPLLYLIFNIKPHIRPQSIGNYVVLLIRSTANGSSEDELVLHLKV